jgi:FeS assembly SUF system protein
VISRDLFERHRLKVLNVAGPSGTSESDYVLEDPALTESAEMLDADTLRNAAIRSLRTISDPEIPLNIYDLGLIYSLDTNDAGNIRVAMTLTSPGCPVAGVLVRQVHDSLRRLPGAKSVRTELIWEPPWSKDRLTDAARLALDLL